MALLSQRQVRQTGPAAIQLTHMCLRVCVHGRMCVRVCMRACVRHVIISNMPLCRGCCRY